MEDVQYIGVYDKENIKSIDETPNKAYLSALNNMYYDWEDEFGNTLKVEMAINWMKNISIVKITESAIEAAGLPIKNLTTWLDANKNKVYISEDEDGKPIIKPI